MAVYFILFCALSGTYSDILLATTTTDLPLDIGRLPTITIPAGSYSHEMAEVRGADGLIQKAPNTP